MSYGYQEPVVQLLSLGRSPLMKEEDRVDYLSLGLTKENVPELIKLAQDLEGSLWFEETDAAYGPIHAWHALGQLQANEGIEPLIALLAREDDSDWIGEEVPRVLATFGAAALDPLTNHLADDSGDIYYFISLSEAIRYIGEDNPDLRDRCVQILINQLQKYRKQDEEINGFLISALMDLRGIEAEALIDKAFKADRVNEKVMGAWPEVKALIQEYKNRPNDSTETINRDIYLNQVMYRTSEGAPTKNYFLLMAPPPDDIDITIERTIFPRSLKRNVATCPACHKQMKNMPAPFAIVHLQNGKVEEQFVNVVINSTGHFCPSCPAVTLDMDQFWQELDDTEYSDYDIRMVAGVLDVAAIPAELANQSIYDIDPPPIVPYLYEGLDGALQEKKRSYVRNKKKKKRR